MTVDAHRRAGPDVAAQLRQALALEEHQELAEAKRTHEEQETAASRQQSEEACMHALDCFACRLLLHG
ncbi:MAG: hypothetical protein SGPRY_008857 [Prymnesium sp.]